jgi:P-type E1-E2 ATPase
VSDFGTDKIFYYIATDLAIAITIIIVSVPEGLPLSITLSLAYSVMRMKHDGILVKNLNSPEVMGNVEEICTGKTATLTKNDMKVTMFYTQSRLIKNSRKNTLFNCELDERILELVKESILFNCEARVEMDECAYYVPVGNGTETGLLKFL